jgi:hypothetical protein
MPGGLDKLLGLSHWSIALQTGILTGVLAVLVSFTPLGRLYRRRFGNAFLIGILTAIGDAYSHAGRSGFDRLEALATGAVSAAIVFVASYLLEDRARRLRQAWSRVTRGQ